MVASSDLLGVRRWGGFSFHGYCCVQIVWNLPSVVLFVFTRCVFNTLTFWENIEDSAPFLEVTFDCLMSPTFLEGFPKWSGETCGKSSCDLVWESVPIFRKFTSCCRVASSISLLFAGGALVGSSWSRVSLLMKGIRKFWRDCFTIASDVPRSIISAFYFYLFVTEKGSQIYSPILSAEISFYSSLLILRGREN